MSLSEPTLDLQPILIGQKILLRPLTAEDFDQLYAASSNPKTWQMHPDFKRYQKDIFTERFFKGAIASGSAFAIVDQASNTIIGSTRFCELDMAKQEIAIGYTFIQCDYWGRGVNDEIKQLMFNHIKPVIKKVWFHVAANNHRSKAAVEKLSAQLMHQQQLPLAEPTASAKEFTQLYYLLEL